MLFFLDEQKKRDRDPHLVEAGRGIVQLLSFDYPSYKYEHRLREIIGICLSPPEGSSIAVDAVLRFKDAVSQRRTCPFQHDDIFAAIVGAQPIAVLDALFPSGATDHSESVALFERRGDDRKQAFDKISPALLIPWCERAPNERFQIAASLITFARRPDAQSSLTWNLKARALMDKAPDRGAVLKVFIDRFHPMSWSGSLASIIEENTVLLDELATEGDPSIASLIRDKKVQLGQEIEKRRRWEIERESEQNESFE